jgi:hypothetical protein
MPNPEEHSSSSPTPTLDIFTEDSQVTTPLLPRTWMRQSESPALQLEQDQTGLETPIPEYVAAENTVEIVEDTVKWEEEWFEDSPGTTPLLQQTWMRQSESPDLQLEQDRTGLETPIPHYVEAKNTVEIVEDTVKWEEEPPKDSMDLPSDPEFELEHSEDSAESDSSALQSPTIGPAIYGDSSASDNEEDDLDIEEPDVKDDGECTDPEGLEFDYRQVPEPLTQQEQMSFAYHDIATTHNVPRAAMQEFRTLQPDKPLDPRTTEKRIACLTGVVEVKYDCCLKGCISYALPKYAHLEQ